MFLKEFSIRRYGPLPDTGLKKTGSFNLFSGPNEEGKTLTIDALLRMLLGKGIRQFKGIKRVDENPDGYLVLEDGDRKEFKLPDAGTVEELFGLSPTEFASIFVIRDSDLSINNESMFYRDITNRLTGLRTGEIDEIKNRIYELGGITAGGEYQNVTPVKLKDKIRKAQSLSERVEELLADLNEEGFSRFEEELAGLEARNRDKVEKLNLYRAAQNRELFEKGEEALGRLKRVLAEAEELKNYNRDDFDAWQLAETSLNHFRNDLVRLEREMEEHKTVLQVARDDLSEKKSAYKKAEFETAAVSEKVEPVLAEYERKYLAVQGQEPLVSSTLYNRTAVVSTLVFILALTGAIFQPAWWLLTMLAVSFAVTATLAWNKYRFLKKKSELAEIEAKVRGEAEKAGLPAGDIQTVRAKISSLKKSLAVAADQLSEAETGLQWQLKEEKRFQSELQEKLLKINETEEKIDKIRRDSGLDTLDQYSAVLDKKEKCKGEAERQSSILSSHFGEGSELTSGEARISFWEEEVKGVQDYAEAAKGLRYDQKEFTRLNEEIEELDRDEKKLSEKMQERHDALRDIEKGINELLHESEGSMLPCQTTLDLEVIQQKLDQWIRDHEDNRANATAALEILSALEQEEEEKVTALFGSDNPVSGYFSQITGGRYREVVFESRENKIRVIRDDGIELDAYQLSGGAYDQLYFSIRLALGEKLLEGNKGFFILDDPFIKADSERLKLLMNMLAGICADGWQILYFSSKGEVKEILQPKIDRGEVKALTVT